MLHGLVGVAALQWTYFVAIDRLPVGMALLLEFQAPILVAVWARLVQKEAVRPRAWVGLALAVLGLSATTGIWDGAVFDPIGIAAGLGAAVCLSTYFVVGEHGVGTLDPLRVIVWSFLVAAVALNLVDPMTGFATSVLDEQVSLLGTLEQYAAPVWLLLGGLWFVEVLGPVEVLGVVAVVSGIVLAQSARRTHVQVEPPVPT